MKLNDKYVEIIETISEEAIGEVPQCIRRKVISDRDAELIYASASIGFEAHSAHVVEMRHAENPVDNQPCLEFEIKDGKVIR